MKKNFLLSIVFHLLFFYFVVYTAPKDLISLDLTSGSDLGVEIIPLQTSNDFLPSQNFKKISEVKKPDEDKGLASSLSTSQASSTMAGATLTATSIMSSLKPFYPLSSRRRKEEGVTKIQVTIDSGGHIYDYKLIRSSGFKSLDRAAQKAVERVLLSPELLSDSEKTSTLELDFKFQLDPS